MKLADVATAMAANGCSSEQIAGTIRYLQTTEEATSNASRQARYRARKTLKIVTKNVTPEPPTVTKTVTDRNEIVTLGTAPRVSAPAPVLYGEVVYLERNNISQTLCLPFEEDPQPAIEPPPRKAFRRDTKADDLTVERFLDMYAECSRQYGLPGYRAITDRRRSHILARGRDMVDALEFPTAEAGFIELFNKIRGSPFLTGRSEKSPFRADLDWIVNEANCLKIMEGRYAKVEKINGNGSYANGYHGR